MEPSRDRPPLPTYAGKGLLAGVDLDSGASLLDLLDDHAAG
jgi:hypothetical protein